MMTGGGNRDSLMADINVTPFVDVMLVLLIIFMVTAPMMVQGVNVDLPQAATETLDADEEHLVVTIDDNRQIFINDVPVALDFLRRKMAAILENRQDRSVYLRADKTISYGLVVRVMAEVKGAGVQTLGMITEPLPSGTPDDQGQDKKP